MNVLKEFHQSKHINDYFKFQECKKEIIKKITELDYIENNLGKLNTTSFKYELNKIINQVIGDSLVSKLDNSGFLTFDNGRSRFALAEAQIGRMISAQELDDYAITSSPTSNFNRALNVEDMVNTLVDNNSRRIETFNAFSINQGGNNNA